MRAFTLVRSGFVTTEFAPELRKRTTTDIRGPLPGALTVGGGGSSSLSSIRGLGASAGSRLVAPARATFSTATASRAASGAAGELHLDAASQCQHGLDVRCRDRGFRFA